MPSSTTTCAGWVTDRVAVAVPAVTVTKADRAEPVVLAGAVTVIVAPVAPVAGDTVNHVSLDDADHEAWFVVTVAVVDPPARGAAHDARSTETLAAGAICATMMVAGVAVPAASSTVVIRIAPVVFAVAVSVTEAPVPPVVGETVNHDES